MNDYSHLDENAAAAIALSEEERIAYIRSDRWIGYPRAKEILSRLEELLNYPRVERPPNVLIVAKTNNGKTRLINHFQKIHPVDPNPGGRAIKVPVLLVSAPQKPDEVALYEAILSSLFVPFKPAHGAREKYRQVIAVLSEIQPNLIAIDEMNNLLAGYVTAQKQTINAIKGLTNELRIPIVGLGTEDALRVIQSDPQMSNRFEPVFLPRWPLDSDFQRMLASFERVIPLAHPSGLGAPNLAMLIHGLSEGTIGEFSRLVNDAAIWAIRNKREQIDETAIKKCGYTPPSKRKTPTLPL